MLSENETNMFFSMLQINNNKVYLGYTRFMISEISLLTDLQQEIEAVVGSDGTSALFYHATTEATKQAAEEDDFAALFTGMSLKQRIEFVLKITQFHGWGIFEIAEFSEEPFRCVIVNKQTYVRDVYGGKADGPRCYYSLGFKDVIEAFAKMGNAELKLQVTETKCRAQGDSHCEWVVEPESPD
ncbi:MAG: hypothetical protein ACFFCO_03005 [Promethearchaeota archaeon]